METLEFLEVKNGKIVGSRTGREVRLRGTNIGGWMNMENFINGYAGTDQTVRHAMKEALGEAKALFFFERMLDYFFGEDDVRFLKENGLNCVRLPVNYRRFEDDERPYVYKEEGFRRLDEALRLCEKYGIYAIIDMHAVQGYQNTHWHSDRCTTVRRRKCPTGSVPWTTRSACSRKTASTGRHGPTRTWASWGL